MGVALASPHATMVLVCLSVATAYAMIGILEFMTEPSAERHHPARSLGVHGGSALVAAGCTLLDGVVNDLVIFGVLVALGVLQIVYGFLSRARHLRWDSKEGVDG